jgi:hypothetical protein
MTDLCPFALLPLTSFVAVASRQPLRCHSLRSLLCFRKARLPSVGSAGVGDFPTLGKILASLRLGGQKSFNVWNLFLRFLCLFAAINKRGVS